MLEASVLTTGGCIAATVALPRGRGHGPLLQNASSETGINIGLSGRGVR